MKRDLVKKTKRVVVKVGTSVLTRGLHFDTRVIDALASQGAALAKKGIQVTFVSSGAIGAGMTLMKMKKRPVRMEALQAAAAVGQRYLMQCWETAFKKHGISTAQVLLTWDDLASQKRFLNAKRTLNQIHAWKHIPIINENDTVATDEIRFGDNDRLSSLLSILIVTDLQVILSDTNGLYSDGGAGERIQVVEKLGKSVFSHVKDSKNSFTVGGMRSKLEAIEMSVGSGIPVFLADGREQNVLHRLLPGEDLGSFFLPTAKKQAGKHWTKHFMNQLHSRHEKRR